MTNLKDASNSDLEDDEENRAAMVKVLERAEYKVLETDNEPTAAGHHQRRGCRHDGDGPAASVLDGVEVLKLTNESGGEAVPVARKPRVAPSTATVLITGESGV